MSAGRLAAVELRRITLDLVTPFRTSFGEESARHVLLVTVDMDYGGAPVRGWGECVAMTAPLYSPEFVDAAALVIEHHLLGRLGDEQLSADDVAGRLAPVKGHAMAKAAVEMAILDAELRHDATSFAEHLGVTRTQVPSGVSVGIFDDIETLASEVEAYVTDGYARIKLKIEPGWDLEPVSAIRRLIGDDMALQVDANAAYRRDDIGHLCRLDEFGLLLIEQPLPEEDLLGHVRLAERCTTPVCLDESIHSAAGAADAIELGACSVVNIKPGRVGGYLEASRVHDVCRQRDVPVWCGGMLETGIGRAPNVALAALDGFTLPGDISGADRFWRRDIVIDPVLMSDGTVRVPTPPGLGFDVDIEFLDEVTTWRRPLVVPRPVEGTDR
ncbi:MAG: o-succinylbenzoate synthase [Actinomycetota bacterium]|nr:o-succinylbenzoate synthase [Actinomycetota bacterium]